MLIGLVLSAPSSSQLDESRRLAGEEEAAVGEAVRECEAAVAELEEQLAVRAMLSSDSSEGGGQSGCSNSWYRGRRGEMGLECQVISSEALRLQLLSQCAAAKSN